MGLFGSKKPKKGQSRYRPCGRVISTGGGKRMQVTSYCTRPAGHSGGCSNVRTD